MCSSDLIDKDNTVRIIDYFVDSLNLSELGFNTNYGENGRDRKSVV